MNDINPATMSAIRTFANLPDRELRGLAYEQASKSVDDRKHRKMNNRILYSVPLVAGIAAAAKTAPRITRVGNFGIGAASWALPFLAVSTAAFVKRGIEKHSKSVRDFNDKHPTLAMLTTLGLSIAGYMAATMGAGKYLGKNSEKIFKTVTPYVDKLSQKLEASKLLNKASEVTAKIPSSVKDISKRLLDFGPWALLFTSFVHSVNHDRVRTLEYANNYNQIKMEQTKIKEALEEYDA